MDIWQYLEIAGVAVGLLYLYFEYKASVWLWLTGIIMPALYIFVYYESGFYADMGINIYYLFAGFYGWAAWRGQSRKKNGAIPAGLTGATAAAAAPEIVPAISVGTAPVFSREAASEITPDETSEAAYSREAFLDAAYARVTVPGTAAHAYMPYADDAPGRQGSANAFRVPEAFDAGYGPEAAPAYASRDAFEFPAPGAAPAYASGDAFVVPAQEVTPAYAPRDAFEFPAPEVAPQYNPYADAAPGAAAIAVPETFAITAPGGAMPITRTPSRFWLPLALVAAGFFAVISYLLINFTDSTVPLGDSFTTALSIVALWMLARKYVEQWLVWIVVDVICSGLYFYKGLYLTGALFALYSIIAVFGYFKWLRMMEKEK